MERGNASRVRRRAARRGRAADRRRAATRRCRRGRAAAAGSTGSCRRNGTCSPPWSSATRSASTRYSTRRWPAPTTPARSSSPDRDVRHRPRLDALDRALEPRGPRASARGRCGSARPAVPRADRGPDRDGAVDRRVRRWTIRPRRALSISTLIDALAVEATLGDDTVSPNFMLGASASVAGRLLGAELKLRERATMADLPRRVRWEDVAMTAAGQIRERGIAGSTSTRSRPTWASARRRSRTGSTTRSSCCSR